MYSACEHVYRYTYIKNEWFSFFKLTFEKFSKFLNFLFFSKFSNTLNELILKYKYDKKKNYLDHLSFSTETLRKKIN